MGTTAARITDCPDCGTPGAVLAGVCDLCLAERHDDEASIAAAGRRAERLLGSLRTQFLRDLGLPRLGAAGAE